MPSTIDFSLDDAALDAMLRSRVVGANHNITKKAANHNKTKEAITATTSVFAAWPIVLRGAGAVHAVVAEEDSCDRCDKQPKKRAAPSAPDFVLPQVPKKRQTIATAAAATAATTANTANIANATARLETGLQKMRLELTRVKEAIKESMMAEEAATEAARLREVVWREACLDALQKGAVMTDATQNKAAKHANHAKQPANASAIAARSCRSISASR